MCRSEFEALLAATFPGAKPLRSSGKGGSWWLPPGPGGGARVGVKVAGNWASLQMNAEHARSFDPVDALSRQSAWPGGVKHVVSGRRPMLRADVPLLLDGAAGRAWVARQLLASSAGLRIASGRETRDEEAPQQSTADIDPEVLAQACAAAGWSSTVKPDGTVRIDIELRSASWAATLHAGAAGVRASVTLATIALATAHAPCRAAAGIFLMRASSALRWARAFVSRENDEFEFVGFECSLAAAPGEQALLAAVDTLIAACELFGRETEVLLLHPEIATRYCEHARGIAQELADDSSPIGVGKLPPPVPTPAAHAAIA